MNVPGPYRYGRVLPYRAATQPLALDLDWARILTWLAVSFTTMLGAVIRLADLDHLSLRIDEGYTLLYMKQTWRAVLGLEGAYDAHPPLYYTLAKVADVFVPLEIASRSVSALLGVLILPLLFVMTARLLDARAAFVATLLLAVAPVSVQFARDGRPYSAVTFVVLLSYAALLEFLRSPRVHWVALYSFCLAVGVYLDYSAVYAIAPQAILLVIAMFRLQRRRLLLLGAVLFALLAYSPWVPQILSTIDALDGIAELSGRAEYLGVTRETVEDSIPYVLGLDGRGSSSGGAENAWRRWPEYRTHMLIFALGAAAAGLCLMYRRLFALVVTLSLMIGVPVAAILVSLISPGYASRTVQMAVIGWCIAVGWFASRLWTLRRPFGPLATGALLAVLITLSTVTLPATMSSHARYAWTDATQTLTEHAHLGKPIIAASTAGMLTDILYLYGGNDLGGGQILTVTDGVRESWYIADRWLKRGPTKEDVTDGALNPLFPLDDPSVDAVWFVSRIGRTSVPRALEELGYQMVLEQQFDGGVLWLWARPGADLGEVLFNNGDFVQGDDTPEGWAIGGGPYRVEDDPTGGRRVVLTVGPAYQALSQELTNAADGIYTLTVKATGKKSAQITAGLHCLDANGGEVARNRITKGFATDEKPSTMLTGVKCPASTQSVLVKIERSGDGDLAIDNTALSYSRPQRE